MDWPTAFTSVGTVFGFALILWVSNGVPRPGRKSVPPRVPAADPMWSSSEVKITAPDGVDPEVFAEAVERVLREHEDRFKKQWTPG